MPFGKLKIHQKHGKIARPLSKPSMRCNSSHWHSFCRFNELSHLKPSCTVPRKPPLPFKLKARTPPLRPRRIAVWAVPLNLVKLSAEAWLKCCHHRQAFRQPPSTSCAELILRPVALNPSPNPLNTPINPKPETANAALAFASGWWMHIVGPASSARMPSWSSCAGTWEVHWAVISRVMWGSFKGSFKGFYRAFRV